MSGFLKEFLNRHFWGLSFITLLLFRLTYLICIQPGNAPDEIGHMVMVVGFAKARYINLAESIRLTNYPYPIYNPMGYFPSSLALFLVSFFNNEILLMPDPFKFTALQNLVARIGMQVWTCGFIWFFLALIKELPLRTRTALVCAVALIPQIIFVQSYVNLDSIGLTVFLYLLWSIKNDHGGHFAFANFLLSCCKMNFFCLFPLPILFLLWKYQKQWEVLLRKTVFLLAVPCLVGFLWFGFSYWNNTRRYGAFLGFNALQDIYKSSTVGGLRIFSLGFLNMTLSSAFGRFGWMSLRFPEPVYSLWRVLLIPAGLFFLYKSFRNSISPKSRFIVGSLSAVVLANLFIHYWASFTNDYQPQGRYIFPLVMILQTYLVFGLVREPLTSRRRKAAAILCVFMFISALAGAKIASKKTDNSKWVVSLSEK